MTRTDKFAEYLSEGFTVSQIAAVMGLTKGASRGLLKRIRDNLGEQAR